MTPPNCIKVKRDGPRGWHYIAKAHYDPALHVVIDDDHVEPFDEAAPLNEEAADHLTKRGPGRPRKNPSF